MYREEVPLITAHGLASPEGLVDIIEFTVCSIQAGLSTIIRQRMDIKVNGLESKYLWGMKKNSMWYVWNNKEVLWLKTVELVEGNCVADLVELFSSIPGIGIVKAGFIVQMLGLNCACMDRHNLKAHNLPITYFQVTGKKKREKIEEYVRFCAADGAEYWWDTWCDFVGDMNTNKTLTCGESVSKYHVLAIMM